MEERMWPQKRHGALCIEDKGWMEYQKSGEVVCVTCGRTSEGHLIQDRKHNWILDPTKHI